MMKNNLELVNDLIEEWYQEFKDDITLDKDLNYNAKVFKQSPNSPIMPNIQIKGRGIPASENLSYGESKWYVMIDVNIYAQDIPNYPRRVVAIDLQEKVYDFFFNEKGMSCSYNDEIPNLDSNLQRILVRFRCEYDLETGIIYRK